MEHQTVKTIYIGFIWQEFYGGTEKFTGLGKEFFREKI
jgi:hypothetical protein